MVYIIMHYTQVSAINKAYKECIMSFENKLVIIVNKKIETVLEKKEVVNTGQVQSEKTKEQLERL